jgi:hypothetical protein
VAYYEFYVVFIDIKMAEKTGKNLNLVLMCSLQFALLHLANNETAILFLMSDLPFPPLNSLRQDIYLIPSFVICALYSFKVLLVTLLLRYNSLSIKFTLL